MSTMTSQEVLNLSGKEPKVLFLNIVVKDATAAVEEKVTQRFKKNMPKSLKGFAARAASGIASPPMIASMLGEKIPQKIMDKVKEEGITLAAEEVFREGPYVVFQIQVIKVDAVLLAQSTKKEDSGAGFFEMGSFVGFGLGLIGTNNQQWVEEGYLPKLVQKKLKTAMVEILAEKLEKKKMVAEIIVLGEAKQARFFFAKYREIQRLKPAGFSRQGRNSGGSNGGSNNSQRATLFRRSSSDLIEEKKDVNEDGFRESESWQTQHRKIVHIGRFL